MAGLDQTQVARLQDAARAIRDGDATRAQAQLDTVLMAVPDHAEALRLLGLLQLRTAQPQCAADTLSRAVALHPGDALLHADLANALARQGEMDTALANWRRACTLDPSQALGWYNLGRNLQQLGRSDEAIEALHRASDLAPTLIPARILLGDALVHTGRLDEAASRYRTALAQHPGCGDAWRGLGNIKTHPLGADDVATMRAQLQRRDLPDSDRIAIGHALGKALEDRGHLDEAFATLVDANARQRRLAPWSAQAFTTFVDAAIAASARLPAPPDPSLGHEAIFIVGMPRSGSTLIEQILAAHPQVEGASELSDLGSVIQDESQRRGTPFPRWIGEASASDWQRLGNAYLQRTAHWRARKPRFTDKLPENWKLAGVLRAMLPGASVIEVRRDPLETAWSCFKQQFYQLPHFACDFDDITLHMAGCARAMDAWRERDPAHLHLFAYEALLADPPELTRALLSACGLPFDAACMDHRHAQRSVRTASAAQVREPLRRDTARASSYGALLDPLRRALASHAIARHA